jgi:Xaa-Pro aminopeptidase
LWCFNTNLGARVSWARDDAKLDRVRALMAEQELDALVVRAPDNVLYLTNFWGMKGYDAVVFPRQGEPVLICLEASEADADRMSWTADVRFFRGYDDADPRPPSLRALDLARQIASDFERVGIELTLGTQATDRMVGEPTTFTKGWFDAFPEAGDATLLLAEARAVKTEQEVERMRLANEIAAAAMELRVNGESRQVSHSGNMSTTIAEILSHYSALGYSAGDVLSTGTVSGVAGYSEDAASL